MDRSGCPLLGELSLLTRADHLFSGRRAAAATRGWPEAALRRNRDLIQENGLLASRGDSAETTPQTSENTDCP